MLLKIFIIRKVLITTSSFLRRRRPKNQSSKKGARNFQLKNFLWVVVWPVASTLIIMLTIPYIIAFGLVPLIPVDESLVSRFQRRVYPAFFFGKQRYLAQEGPSVCMNVFYE